MIDRPEAQQVSSAQSGTGWLYGAVDRLSGFWLLASLILGPWLFGTTENWSVWTLNVIGYWCGLLLLVKWWFRWRSGALAVEAITLARRREELGGRLAVRGLAVLTIAVLLFCLISALNARATFHPGEQIFYYHSHVRWLPFTYDSIRTWQAFWNYLALACYFWALRDWLLHPRKPVTPEEAMPVSLPPRFQALLWTIAVNATVLTLIGIFQKLSGADKLLWVRETYMGRADYMFASFAYRGNAAEYLNLAWPAIIALWWASREKARQTAWDSRKIGGGAHLLLLPCAIITASGPMITLNRSGALILFGGLAVTLFVFFSTGKGTWKTRCAILFVSLSVLAFGGALAWEELAPRLRDLFKTPYANPNEVYANARQMAVDYPVFGVGPGAFGSIYQIYREDPDQPWQVFLHDDWLETRVTFGWVGASMILAMLALVLAKWFLPGGVPASWEFVAMLWVALGGCLAGAKFGFPLQVYSILALALTLCCILSCLTKPEPP